MINRTLAAITLSLLSGCTTHTFKLPNGGEITLPIGRVYERTHTQPYTPTSTQDTQPPARPEQNNHAQYKPLNSLSQEETSATNKKRRHRPPYATPTQPATHHTSTQTPIRPTTLEQTITENAQELQIKNEEPKKETNYNPLILFFGIGLAFCSLATQYREKPHKYY